VSLRVGLGYDSHRFAAGRPLILGGVTIPHDRGLAGHSDADAVAHALTDAILGAAGLGDIGTYFPPGDPRWKDADSIGLLRLAHAAAVAAGWRLHQADVTVIAEAPRVGPHARAMAGRLAEATGADPARIGIKGKSNEGMGWIGQGEGIAVLAVATLEAAH
jgi:2-C-methyl-D-erythritol 2,4-cyclodiphosphate synthase